MVWNGVVVLKKLFFLFLLSTSVFSSDKGLAIKIYLSIAHELTHESVPKFYLQGEIEHLSHNEEINKVSSCEEADIVILHSIDNLSSSCVDKLVFTDYYKTYLDNEGIVGAFFWQKGRPNIVFREEVLKDKNITLSPSFRKYIE